ncbi:MAG: hypothetical protein METHAR1v1_190007 [Methanothrix sp.]|jgi:nickel transport protein|nr:MAG: hypothetical protein METHAR1v1_190007 [Methanothrix sp.]
MNEKNCRMAVLALISVLILAGTAAGHRMLIGYTVEEVGISVFYDDGTAAAGANVMVYDGDDLIAEGAADSRGVYRFRPEGRRIDDLVFVSSSVGHRAEIRIGTPGAQAPPPEIPTSMKVLAGFGYLLGIAGVSMIYASRKKR